MGVNVKTFVGKNLLTDIEVAAVEALIVGGARKRVALKMTLNDDESKDYAATVTEVQKVQDTLDSGSLGEAVTAFSGRNVDAADLDAIAALVSGIRKNVTLELSGNDDGTLNYSARITEPKKTEI